MSTTAGRFPLSIPDLDTLSEFFRQRGTFCADVLPPAALAHLVWAIWEKTRQPMVWITDGPRTLDLLAQDVRALGMIRHCPDAPAVLPAWESMPPTATVMGERLAALKRCLTTPPPILLTNIQALMQRAPTIDSLQAGCTEIANGMTLDRDELVQRLETSGYQFALEVVARGQASVRGGILDLWIPSEDWPVRIEFFGSEIESLRWFDAADQKSRGPADNVTVTPAAETALPLEGTIFDYTKAFGWAWIEIESIQHHAALHEELTRESNAGSFAIPFAEARKLASGLVMDFGIVESASPRHTFGLTEMEGVTAAIEGHTFRPDAADESRHAFMSSIAARRRAGWQLDVVFATEGARARFVESFGETLESAGGAAYHLAALSEGYAIPDLHQLVLTESDIYGQRRRTTTQRTTVKSKGGRVATERVTEWTDVQPGDYVVHIDHGIGRYSGLFEIEFNGELQEVLTVEYADNAKLHLPVSQSHLLSRYVGVGKVRPVLHSLGAKRWQKEKIAAQKAVHDLAAQLLETQAMRDAQEGFAFPPDTTWQHEFEMAFAYEETPDQLRAIEEVKKDMESRRPMDRLVCGDVGYGKTEVAMRAAFKAVMGGKQVAMLVPTTVLAQQHGDTFAARMAAWPIRIGVLSRFQTAAEQRDVVEKLAAHQVDVVIGTHRLISGDVKFADLGLVIVDEEQRFGVNHKEHFKHIRKLVDVMTLTATPIPRTLYMSLTGARDLSTIQTPPVERLPIETVIAENTDEVVRNAILRELNREGQIFYLHNRVKSIEVVYDRLSRLVPEARIEFAHGQMNETQLAAVMHAFGQGKFDVLLCTTIIESGLDMPNVNTILIERADRFGLAELYQLRGRVGRYKRQAYAYLLLPRHGALFDQARKRIGAIRRYGHLGSGFKLAMRDLEIRGAGNLLGAQQSGHIAAVGFDLYCQYLQRTVAIMKGEKPPPIIDVTVKLDFVDLSTGGAEGEGSAVIPTPYIEDEGQRISIYRRLAGAATGPDLDRLRQELRDRFGRIPAAMDRLLNLALLRITAHGNGIRQIEVEQGKVLLTRRNELITVGGKLPRLEARGVSGRLLELLKLVKQL